MDGSDESDGCTIPASMERMIARASPVCGTIRSDWSEQAKNRLYDRMFPKLPVDRIGHA